MRRFLIYSLLLVVACGDGGASSTLQYYFTYDPRSLDPALSTDVPTGEVIALLFDNLTQFNTDGDLEPGLARTWETDSTGQTYTFHIRSGATFHDGTPLTLEDVCKFLRVSEQLRKGAFYSGVIDMKTTQLILFGMLLAEHNPVGAQAHAAAARKAGASWEELHTVMQLAAATGALWAANNGGALLKTLRDKEHGGKP